MLALEASALRGVGVQVSLRVLICRCGVTSNIPVFQTGVAGAGPVICSNNIKNERKDKNEDTYDSKKFTAKN